MKLFASTDHPAFYVGGTSIVLAEDEAQARALLDAALAEHGLDVHSPQYAPYTFVEIDMTVPKAVVLDNGDY